MDDREEEPSLAEAANRPRAHFASCLDRSKTLQSEVCRSELEFFAQRPTKALTAVMKAATHACSRCCERPPTLDRRRAPSPLAPLLPMLVAWYLLPLCCWLLLAVPWSPPAVVPLLVVLLALLVLVVVVGLVSVLVLAWQL